MKIRSMAAAGALALGLGAAAGAAADTVSVSLPAINGPEHETGFPIDLGDFGPFVYVLPADATITAAFFEGTFGTEANSFSTAAFDAVIDGEQYTVCPIASPTCFTSNGTPFRPFSIALNATLFPELSDGSATLSIIQTSLRFVRLGTPSLRIEYDTNGVQPIPEPGVWALMLLGFGARGAALRARRGQALAAA